ncbi:MAG TPA: TonB-dependent receptor [Burkholderiales bacterium]|jgi:vitamin B12 transporter
MFRPIGPGALVLALVPSFVVAQEDAVVVTASRTEQRLRDAIPHTTVLTQKEIRDSQAVDLPTLLRSEAGFEMAQTGGMGSVPSPLSLRGGTSARALVLIDGVRIEDVGVSSTALQHIMLDQVERVEIARGNLSSLYGSNAVGGVIQIFTKRGTGAPAPYAQAMAGSRNTYDVSAGYGGELGATRFNVTASRLDTKGFSAQDPALAPLSNPDPDGYRNQSISLSGSHRLNPAHELGVAFFGTAAYLDYDSSFGPPTGEHRSNQDLSMLQGWWEARFVEWWKSRVTLAESKDRRTDTLNDTFANNGNTRTRQLFWDNDLRVTPAHVFSIGVEGREQVRDSGSSFSGANPQRTRDVSAGRLGYVGRLGDHTLQANYRYEDYSDFGSEGTYFLGYGYDLTAAWRLTLSRGTAFRAPTFLDLDPLFLGNPDLQPERSSTNEIGLQWASERSRVRVTYFDTEYEDAIVLSPAFMPQNVQTASNKGIETSYSGVLAGFDLRASLTFQDPVEQDRTNLPPQQALRRAKTLAALAAHRGFGAWRLGGEWRYSGERRDQSITNSSVTVFEGAYSVLDLMARYQFSKNLWFGARLENALDEEYRYVNGYNTAGRGIFFSAGWQP